MNYIKPEDIKEYVSKNPTGIAGMSKELTEMVNYFTAKVVVECLDIVEDEGCGEGGSIRAMEKIKEHFEVEE